MLRPSHIFVYFFILKIHVHFTDTILLLEYGRFAPYETGIFCFLYNIIYYLYIYIFSFLK